MKDKYNKYRKSKKGVSLMISYVLLIGIVLTLSVIVGSWIYFQAKNPPMMEQDVCEGVTIAAENIKCTSDGISANLINTGRFMINKVSVRYDEDRDVLRCSMQASVQLPPGKEVHKVFKFNSFSNSQAQCININKIKKVKFVPLVGGSYCADQTTYDVECQTQD
ncbi:hypothetical protein B6U80_02565 [Candidatus Pacearchaeota archaeon ex4484_26]|nr:MAG: hypothetical protein B6U80_02565 [Candidatus Pacearchaeota archaeon ex4484_26]